MRIRVAQVISSLHVGGLEKVALSLAGGLDRGGFESYLVALNGEGPLAKNLPLDADHCLLLHPSTRMQVAGFSVDLPLMWRLRGLVRKHRIDVLHVHNLAPLVYGGIAARLQLPRPAVLYSEHNQVYSAGPALKRRFRHYIKLADRAIAVSRDLKQHLDGELKVSIPVDVVHNGIEGPGDTAFDIAEVRREFQFEPEDLIIGTGVVLSKQKGIPHLLNAFPAIRQRVPRARLLIAGDGPLRETLTAQAQSLGIAAFVRFAGYRSDMLRLISAFDVYVLPSLWEGLPLALLEALACSKPIVTTRVGGNPEVVEDGVNGFVVEAGDESALADRIVRLLEDAPLRAEMGVRNRSRFAAHFSRSAMLRSHENIYTRLVRPAAAVHATT